jgi:hypothetical protein
LISKSKGPIERPKKPDINSPEGRAMRRNVSPAAAVLKRSSPRKRKAVPVRKCRSKC